MGVFPSSPIGVLATTEATANGADGWGFGPQGCAKKDSAPAVSGYKDSAPDGFGPSG